MKLRLVLPLVALFAFGAYSVWVVAGHGYFGFLSLAWREPWAMQMLLDITIAIGLFTCWMIPDARQRGILVWPYLALCLTLGSIGALAYLVHRALRGESVAPRGEPARAGA